ncbi:MAG TPA: enoyl-CoA hydratase-related protein [Nocardioidaceae bacterium]|nr:enoyl-CoA hydratase-related protein [Nocardioidaceae bacterium]
MTDRPAQIPAGQTPADQAPVRYESSDGVVTIRLDRPESMNSLDTASKAALLAAVRRAAEDPAARCVVLTGSGRAFCVGQDLKEHAGNLASRPLEEVWSTVAQHYSPIAQALATMPKPVVAAVNGVAAGAGMSIAMACDWRFAADTASFSTAFAGIGLSCDTGSSWTLQRLVGPTRAMELLLWPRKVEAAEALELGLVNWVVPADELAGQVSDAAGRLAAGPSLAFAAIKASVRYAATHTLEEALAFEAEMMARTGSSQDHRNAVDAFMAKQRPTFTGT